MTEERDCYMEKTFLPNRASFDAHPERFLLQYDDLPKSSRKYWKQRYSLFSKFDEGVYMNKELWYSVTPEMVAIFIAKFIQACDPSVNTVLDVFSGGGGNTIQMARYFNKVIGVDMNEEHIYCTEKNSEIYGVMDKIELHLAMWPSGINVELLSKFQNEVDFVFASPPWGGPGYTANDSFDLTQLEPIPLADLLRSFFQISPNVCLFLPRNSNLDQLSQVTRDLCGETARCRVLYVHSEGYLKGIYAIWGEKFMPTNQYDTSMSSLDYSVENSEYSSSTVLGYRNSHEPMNTVESIVGSEY